MRKLLPLLLLITFTKTSFSQTSMLTQWDKKVLEKANTAKDASYMTDEEKRVIFLFNLARINPPLFNQTIVPYFLDTIGYKNSVYVVSLRKTLSNTKAGQVLVPAQDLFDIAKDHAISMGKSGKKGHEGFEKRFKVALKTYKAMVGENCSYGFDNALRIVMQLLIDEGAGDSGHRKNILDPKYTSTGVAIREHKITKWNCVIAFGG